MSTKSSLVYLDRGDIHLFREVLDSEDNVYLSLPPAGNWEASPHFIRVSLSLDRWDELVDAYVERREKERKEREDRRRKNMRCLNEHGEHEWEDGSEPQGLRTAEDVMRALRQENFGPRCRRCGGYAHDDPSALERLSAVVEP